MLPTDFRFPAFLAEIGPRLPQRPWSDALCAGLELARLTRQIEADFSFLEGRTVRIVVEDLGARATLRYTGGHFRTAPANIEADVSFRAAAADFLKLVRRTEDPDTLFFQRKLRIEGDTELGLTLKNLLDSIEPPAWLTKLLA
ncbi:MAG: SCP2 sterol-binding domain-containing protein [Candidatus Dactylopiibacterium sp.]|nr:SCP2 sterol-binding domain-containing protein [Candidatus Dactylopiibacterium sp.]